MGKRKKPHVKGDPHTLKLLVKTRPEGDVNAECRVPKMEGNPHAIVDFIEDMKQGISVIKHGRQGKPKQKVISLDVDEQRLNYHPTKKKCKRIHTVVARHPRD
mmetsp:Transcript_63391/g.113103  ORF Transcript_63391/g.113103 Transcript_63391/m.113103 type:complete len:103 (-) Transcript_63391:1572-1880(-)